jgi:hypothetical protein
MPFAFLAVAAPSPFSSHREAPFITENPKVDGTDFYMFRSYESGRGGYVTLVADYLPLQDPYGGPNYFSLDPDALYEISVDNDGDAREDITFQFRFNNQLRDIGLDIGPAADRHHVSVPLVNVGPISAGNTQNLNLIETYQVRVVFGDRRTGESLPVANAIGGSRTFEKPVDDIGAKSIPDYASYAAAHLYDIQLPGGFQGRMFVGQRKDPFVVNLGETFDLVNLNPLGPTNGKVDTLADKNVTALVLEVPIEFLTAGSPTIGGWQPSSTRFPHGLKFLLDQIRQAGMVPGLWLEPEVAGAKSLLAQQPNHWFFMRHGKRVLKNSRFLAKKEVVIQYDIGNAAEAGADARVYLKKKPGRVASVHVKPFSKSKPDALIGDDELPWPEIFKLCETVAGVEWYIMEYEREAEPPLVSVDKLLQIMRRMGKA